MFLQRTLLNHKNVVCIYILQVIFSLVLAVLLSIFIRLVARSGGVSIFDLIPTMYYSSITLHGIVMIFFVFSVLFFGVLINLIVPVSCVVTDFIYPQLNMLAGFILVVGLVFGVVGILFSSGVSRILLPPHSESVGSGVIFIILALLCV